MPEAGEETATPPAPALEGVVAFGRILRRAGLQVGTGRLLLFARALDLVDPLLRLDVYWAGRSTLVARPEDIRVFDAAFSVFWDGVVPAMGPPDERQRSPVEEPEEEPEEEDLPEASGQEPAHTRPVSVEEADEAELDDDERRPSPWSPIEILRQKDFAEYEPDEYLLARRLMERIRADPPLRPSRRPQLAPRGRLDLRRTLRASLRSGGLPIERSFRRRGTRSRRLVLIADVSGSMERYSRALLQFLHASVAGGRHVEAFVFGTRLTRVTKELRSLDPDRALHEASRSVVDWGGGTRIGAALAEFNRVWGRRGMARGAIVVILSDGWERGGAEQLAEEMAGLGRLARRIVWVNPLKAAPGYAPLAAGMAAALPHVDEFVEGHNLGSLEQLTRILQRVTR